jgi:hypothetical protein
VDQQVPSGEAAVAKLDWHHHNSSLDAFSAAVKLAPKCLATVVTHTEALVVCHRYGEAQAKICATLTVTTANNQDDLPMHNVHYALAHGSTKKARKYQVSKARPRSTPSRSASRP